MPVNDIAAFGSSTRVIASKTFPAGFTVTAYADDADGFDLPTLQINDGAMGLNGDAVTWSTANLIPATIAVIPGSQDDKNLAVLFERNRAARGKKPAKDAITIVHVYPDGSTVTLTDGFCYDFTPGRAVASGGRLKSRVYSFRFANRAGTEV